MSAQTYNEFPAYFICEFEINMLFTWHLHPDNCNITSLKFTEK